MVSEEEQALIQERMDEAGIRNMGAYMRKMALNGYVLPVVSLEICWRHISTKHTIQFFRKSLN